MIKTVLGLGSKWKWFFPIIEDNKYNSGYLFDTPYKRIVKKKKENNQNNQNKDDDKNNKKKKDKKDKKEKSVFKCGC